MVRRGCRAPGGGGGTLGEARALSDATAIPSCHLLADIDAEADLYLLAVSDEAIVPVARALYQLGLKDKLLIHTSGATPAAVLRPFSRRFGVFYPLQTFSRERAIDFSKIPICIQANRTDDETRLLRLGQRLSRSVHRIDDRQRAVLHVAAVFANNFSNHLFEISAQVLEREDLPFDLLRPLIEETAAKVQTQRPADMQTGPAIRGDRTTIERHLDFLDDQPRLRALYRSLTELINPDIEL